MIQINDNEIQSRLEIAGIKGSVEILTYEGVEGFSMLFRFDMVVALRDVSSDPGTWVRQNARLAMQSIDGIRHLHGVISRVTYLENSQDRRLYRIELVPRLWLATHQHHCRIFQNRSVPNIVQHVLQHSLIAPSPTLSIEENLIEKHVDREYCVQYRETDFHFISRLLEEEGIHYRFEHDENECRMVLSDSIIHRPLPSGAELPYVPPSGMVAAGRHVHAFCRANEVRPDTVALNDYNYEKPSLNLQSEFGENKSGSLEISDYPGNYQSQAVAAETTRLRLQELACGTEIVTGRSNCVDMAAGRVFSLSAHPIGEFNGEYTLTKIRHVGRSGGTRTSEGAGESSDLDPRLRQTLISARTHKDPVVKDLAEAVLQFAQTQQRQRWPMPSDVGQWVQGRGDVLLTPQGMAAARGGDPRDYLSNGKPHGETRFQTPIYECEFECIPFETTFRPPRLTSKPVVHGSQTAVVVGPEGREIYTDELGRVKVRFFWDRDDYMQRDKRQKSDPTCWIRVSQPWAGKGYGGLTVPRIGQEVIVDFLEGDPDRPIITGRVYNRESMQPSDMVKPKRKTGKGDEPIAAMQGRPQSLPAAATRSSIRGNSTPGGGGANEITIDDAKGSELLYINASKDSVRTVANDETVTVGNDRKMSVGNDLIEFIANNHDFEVGVDETIKIGSNQKQEIGVDRTEDVGSNHTEKIGANRSLTVGSNETRQIGANMTETVAVAKAESIGAAKALSIGAAYQVSVGGLMNETVAAAKLCEVGAKHVLAIGGGQTIKVGGDHKQTVSGSHKEKAREIKLTADTKLVLSCGASTIEMTPATITIKAPLVKINC